MTDLVIGMGEIGRPLANILSMTRTVFTKDIGPLDIGGSIDAMHICYPYGNKFADATAAYIFQYVPDVTIIHSTVVPGTTEEVKAVANARTGNDEMIAYSPVRGRHGQMHRDLLRYGKFVAAPDKDALMLAAYSLEAAYFDVVPFAPCAGLELAKLLETTYSGLLIAWAQDMERFCQGVGARLNDVLTFTREVEYLPDYAFYPGHIGGHCIIPNLDLLEDSPFVRAIRESNDMTEDDGQRYEPRRL